MRRAISQDCLGGGRLSRDRYKQSATTPSFQSSLTPEEIRERLSNYKMVTDIDYVGVNTHLRYFVQDPKTGEWKFRLGGFLKKKDNPKYVILSTSPQADGKTWSVARGDKVKFFQIKSPQERQDATTEALSNKYQSALEQQQAEIDKLKAELAQVRQNQQTAKR